MFKNKYVLISVIVIGVIGLGAAGYFVMPKLDHNTQLGQLFDSNHTDTANLGDANNTSPAGSQTTTNSDNGLIISPGASLNSLGQLAENTNSSQNSSSSTAGSNSGSTAGSSSASDSNSAANQALNPSTFGQYNTPKYLDATNAFFADLQAGTGTALTAGHTAEVIYKGWLTNGTLFDESKPDSSGQLEPFSFEYGATPSQVIPGWEEGLAGMKVGGVRLLIIPPAAGYGDAAQGAIPANSVLVFAVQLVSVQ